MSASRIACRRARVGTDVAEDPRGDAGLHHRRSEEARGEQWKGIGRVRRDTGCGRECGKAQVVMDTGEGPRGGAGPQYRQSGEVQGERRKGIGRDRGGTHVQEAEVKSRLSGRDRLKVSERWPSRTKPLLMAMAEMVGLEMKVRRDKMNEKR